MFSICLAIASGLFDFRDIHGEPTTDAVLPCSIIGIFFLAFGIMEGCQYRLMGYPLLIGTPKRLSVLLVGNSQVNNSIIALGILKAAILVLSGKGITGDFYQCAWKDITEIQITSGFGDKTIIVEGAFINAITKETANEITFSQTQVSGNIKNVYDKLLVMKNTN